MPHCGMLWRHVVINTKNSWHHGDRLGFRSRQHRIHSSGDYKKPPPKGEHAGLLQYRRARSGDPISFGEELRVIVGRRIVEEPVARGYRVLSVIVIEEHVHIVIELPWQLPEVKRIIGEAKGLSSRAIKDFLTGSVWAYGGTFKMVKSKSHLRRAFSYVLFDQGPDAWAWSYTDGSPNGTFGRIRPDDE